MTNKNRKRLESVGLKNIRENFLENKGTSRFEAKQKLIETHKNPNLVSGIRSAMTFENYKKHFRTYLNWLQNMRPECKTFNESRGYVADYLREKMTENKSAWTIRAYAYALCAAYAKKISYFKVDLPIRRAHDVVRSRYTTPSNQRVANLKFDAVKEFCRGVGPRRGGIKKLTVDDVVLGEKDGKLRVRLDEKGGKVRYAEVLPQFYDVVLERKANPRGALNYLGKRLLFARWELSTALDIHGLRREYAMGMYRHLEAIGYGNSSPHHLAKPRDGEIFDKKIVARVSRNIGHNRLGVTMLHYFEIGFGFETKICKQAKDEKKSSPPKPPRRR
jgi:integrase